MAEVASAFVSLMPSARGFGSKLDSQIGPEVDKSGKKSGLSFGKLFAAGAALGIGAKAFSFLGDSLAEAKDAQVIGARTENVIKKMGDAANISAAGVGRLAESISKKTGIDDEAIQSGQNLLLTFANVSNQAGKGNDIFNQTSKLMVDMSAAMGTDAKGSAIQLGKALNDPVKGITALSRVGVSFSEKQKEQIANFVKSGDTMKAQKVILGELEKQFGGAAKSMATPGEKAAVAFGNLKEQIGTALLPVVESLSKTFTNDIAPAVSTFITEMQNGEGAGGRFRAKLDDIGSALKKVGGFVKDNAKTLAILVTGLGAAYTGFQTFMFIKNVTLAVRAFNLMLAANPIGLVVLAIAALAVGLVLAYKKSDTFRAIVDKAFSAISVAGKALWEGALKPAFEGIKKGFEAVGKAGVWLWNNALQPTFKFIVSGVASILDMWSAMLSALGKVPGFEWAKKAADAMGAAAVKAREFADGIKKIPTSKTVTVTTVFTTRSPGKEKSMGDDFLSRAGVPPKNEADALFEKRGRSSMEALGRGFAKGGKKAAEQLGKALDGMKAKMSDLVSAFESLASSVASAFNPDMFGATGKDAVTEELAGIVTVITPATTALQEFLGGLNANNSNLAAMLAAFDQLKAAGASTGFLSALFASGNSTLATQLAAAGPAAVKQASALFDENAVLAAQLGNKVATNELGPRMDQVRAEITELRKDLKAALKESSKDTGKEVASRLTDARIEIIGADAGQQAYLRTGRR